MNKKILSSLLLIGLMVGCSTNNASSTSSNNDSTSNITTSSKLNDKNESSSLNSSNSSSSEGESFVNIDGYKVPKIKNIKYDEIKCKFVWDNHSAAKEGYIIKIDGEEIETITNEYSYIPITDVVEVQVRANGVMIISSDNWTSYTYNVPKEGDNLASINVFVNKIISYSDLQKIVSINIKDNILYTEAVFSGSTFYKFEQKYEHKLESLEDAMDEEMPYTYIDDYFKISEYNSAKYLLESNEFVGQLEEYRQSGYEVSILSSQTVNDDHNTQKGDLFYIYATYKLDNGSDIKYVKSNIRCIINNPSTNEQINYTVRLKDPNQRALEEYNFEIISPEAVIFSELMDKYLNQNT